MNVYGKSFVFNDKNINEFLPDAMLVSINTSNDERDILKIDYEKSEFALNKNIVSQYGGKYSEPLTFDLCITRKSGEIIPYDTARKITAWLISVHHTEKLEVLDCLDDIEKHHENILYYGVFTACKSFETSGVNVLTYSFECNAPYGFERVEYSYSAINSTGTIRINNTSDELNVPVYPYLHILPKETGALLIKNANVPEEPFSISVISGADIYVNSQNCIIKDVLGNTSLSFFKHNLNWLSLVSGTNTLEISGTADITFVCEYPRKVGA